jgi:hypothetical protein
MIDAHVMNAFPPLARVSSRCEYRIDADQTADRQALPHSARSRRHAPASRPVKVNIGSLSAPGYYQHAADRARDQRFSTHRIDRRPSLVKSPHT